MNAPVEALSGPRLLVIGDVDITLLRHLGHDEIVVVHPATDGTLDPRVAGPFGRAVVGAHEVTDAAVDYAVERVAPGGAVERVDPVSGTLVALERPPRRWWSRRRNAR